MRPLPVVLLAILVLAVKRSFELVIENEYATWAPALARLLARAAGFVYWPRLEQWRADLRYVQQVEEESGLLAAGWCLLSVPWLLLRHVVTVLFGTCLQQCEKRVSLASGLLVAGVIITMLGLVGGGPERVLIRVATFSPDGKLLAGAGDGGVLQLWDAASHQPLGQPFTTGASASVTSVVFSSDDKLLASVASDNKVQLWDVASRRRLGHPRSRGSAEDTVAFNSVDKLEITRPRFATPQLGVGVSGVTAPAAAAALIEPSVSGGAASAAGRIAPVATFSRNGGLRADASDNGTVQISDAASGQLLGQPLSAGGTDPIASLVFSPDSKLLVRVDKDGTVGLWNLADRNFFMMPEEIALTSPTTSVVTAGMIITLVGSLCAAGIARLRAELDSDKAKMAPAQDLLPQGVLLRKLPSRSQADPKAASRSAGAFNRGPSAFSGR